MLKKLLVDNKYEEVLDLMLKSQSYPENAIIILKGRFLRLQREQINQIIDDTSYRRELNILTTNILDLIDATYQTTGNEGDIIQLEEEEKPHFVIASNSPRRRELLNQVGFDYEIWDPNVPDVELTEEIDFGKAIEKAAESVKNKIVNFSFESKQFILDHDWKEPNTIVLSFQTYVIFENKILDKPLSRKFGNVDAEELQEAKNKAFEILKSIRNKTVKIVTVFGAALASSIKEVYTYSVISEAYLRNYTNHDINSYVNTNEPLDKAGAFGIQEKGVFLFKKVVGSYFNIVGLPIREVLLFIEEKFKDSVKKINIFPKESPLNIEKHENPTFWPTILCIGDVNCDYIYIYEGQPEVFFPQINEQKKIQGKITMAPGGTAMHFAKSAAEVGFKECKIIGTIGKDAGGTFIKQHLEHINKDTNKVEFAVHQDASRHTGMSLILMSKDQKSNLIISHSEHLWKDAFIEPAHSVIDRTDSIYVSGYCLMDKRAATVTKIIKRAKERKKPALVLLDCAKGMNNHLSFEDLIKETTYSNEHYETNMSGVDIFVVEFPEIFSWLNINYFNEDQLSVWKKHKDFIATVLRQNFKVSILRTANYTHEVLVTPHEISEPIGLDYETIEDMKKIGYNSKRTSKILYSFISPRIVLASKSPQRMKLLSQIVAPEKIVIQVSGIKEFSKHSELPHEKVERLSFEKANDVLLRNKFESNIEFIIGADTEIAIQNSNNSWEIIGDPHPKTPEDAKKCISKLNSKYHYAFTGVTVIGVDSNTKSLKKITRHAKTKIKMACLSEKEIDLYIKTNEFFDRAGGYAIQGVGGILIESIDGSYSNIVGLPLELLTEILIEEFGRKISDFDSVSDWKLPIPVDNIPNFFI